MVARSSAAVLGALVAGLALCSLAQVARQKHALHADAASHALETGSQVAGRGGAEARAAGPVMRRDSALRDEAPSADALVSLREGRALDLNRACARDLELLPGIGPSLARRIVEYRQQQVAYRSLEQLVEVRGIGQRTLTRLRPMLQVGAGAPPQPR